MTSLALGLMLNTTKNRFDGVSRDVHSLATGIIVLHRTLITYGPDAAETGARLKAYVSRAANGRWTTPDQLLVSDPTSEQLLESVGAALRAIQPADERHLAIWKDANEEYRRIVELRWGLLEQPDGSIPPSLLALVVAWLVLIFANFGYGAVHNPIVIATLVIAAPLMSATLYVLLELDAPFSGTIRMSTAPLERALAELRR